MAGSYSAEVWLDSYRWDALEAVLEGQGSSIEQHLQDYLLDLYREMVPADQAREIESRIEQERLENTGRVAGVFELDFDKQVFSAVSVMDGWKSYWFQDVSAAAYHAFRKEKSSQDERWQKFLARLDGKELTDRDLSTPLKALRELQPGDLLFTGPAERRGCLIDFQVDCASDRVRLEVFGPKVTRTGDGSWLDIRASYDVSRQEVQDHLDLTLFRTGGAREKSFRYDLSLEEQELFQSEMEVHCQKRYGKTLNGLYAERYRLGPACTGWGDPPTGSEADHFRGRYL